MNKILVEISWLGLINYSENDIRIALVQKFKSTNFSVKRIIEEVPHDYQESIMLDLEKLPEETTSITIPYKNIH